MGSIDTDQGCANKEPLLQTLKQLILNGRHVILAGPPGTGKTKLVLDLKDDLANESYLGEFSLIQFHPDYSYQDLIDGFAPSESGSGFIPKPGKFREFVNKISKREIQGNQASGSLIDLFVIDEINRGNVASIFGELLTLLDDPGRKSISTARSTDPLSLPASVAIVGTMNTADKSIMLMDFALRRRFSILFVPPDYDGLNEWLNCFGFDFDDFTISDFVQAVETLNKRIGSHPLLGKRMTLGQSLFIPKLKSPRKFTINDLAETFNQVVFPQLEAYLGVGSLSELDSIVGEHIRKSIQRGENVSVGDFEGLIMTLKGSVA